MTLDSEGKIKLGKDYKICENSMNQNKLNIHLCVIWHTIFDSAETDSNV